MRRHFHQLDLTRLRKDFYYTVEKNAFEDSHHKHSISLLTEDITPDSHKTFHNNLPFNSHSLSSTPYFEYVWKLFSELSEVTCLRIMEKLPNTGYGLHNDKDAGEIMRFQIPIFTNDSCWLAVTNVEEIDEGWTDDNTYFKKDLEKRFGNDVKFYQLEEGYIYRFDTNYIHTLTNEGETSRYTLLVDVKTNDKVVEFVNNNFLKVT